jgi:hypothetical protein
MNGLRAFVIGEMLSTKLDQLFGTQFRAVFQNYKRRDFFAV